MDVYRCHEFIIKIFVIPAQAGIQRAIELDPGLRLGMNVESFLRLSCAAKVWTVQKYSLKDIKCRCTDCEELCGEFHAALSAGA